MALKYGRNMLIDEDIFLFLDDDDIDPERLPGKGMFDVKIQNVRIGQKLQADGIAEGGVPRNTLMIGVVYRGFTVAADRKPPASMVDNPGRLGKTSAIKYRI
jgi:hypothetical protein